MQYMITIANMFEIGKNKELSQNIVFSVEVQVTICKWNFLPFKPAIFGYSWHLCTQFPEILG